MPATTVTLAGPLDLRSALEPLRRSGDDLLDRWDGTTLLRTVRRAGGGAVAYAATVEGGPDRPRLRVEVAAGADLPVARQAVERLVIDVPADLARLAAADPVLGVVAARHPGVTQLVQPDLFTALVRAVSAQQVNLRWAATTRARIAQRFGDLHAVAGGEVWSLDPARIAALEVADLRALQLTTRKAEYIIGVAAEVAAGRLDIEELRRLPDGDVVARLVAVRGLGRWTAEWVLARTLGRPVVVAGDLAVRKVVAQAYLGLPIAAEDVVRDATAHWGAAATAAQGLLLHAAAHGDDLAGLCAPARRAR